MKLCIISPTFPLPGKSPYIGPDNVVYNLIKGIIEIDNSISIDVVTISNDIKKAFIDERFPNVIVNYLPRLRYLPRSFGDPIIIKKFFQMHDFDLIHAHYPIALAKVMNLKIPKILTLHGIFIKEKKFEKNPLRRIIYHNYNTYMLKKILPKIDGFVAISPYVIDTLKEMNLYHDIKNIFQINNAIDDSYFEVVSNPSESVILYPGVVQKLKNQMAAVETVKILKDMNRNLKLVLVGCSDKKYLEQLLCEVNKNNCSDFVEYLGSVPRQKMLDLYGKASIVYLLSYQEVQPMAILEAMATGTPVIASNLKSISYIIDDGVTGYLVNPDDPEEIAKYTEMLLSDRKKWLELGENAKTVAQNRYSSETIAIQTLEMYQKILNLKR